MKDTGSMSLFQQLPAIKLYRCGGKLSRAFPAGFIDVLGKLADQHGLCKRVEVKDAAGTVGAGVAVVEVADGKLEILRSFLRRICRYDCR